MILKSGCKINIGLYITERREDGFHNLESLFYPVNSLFDLVEVVKREDNEVCFSQSGIEVECESENNLCVKAYRAFASHYPLGGVNIHLHKSVPFGAGLGGGSANAAAVILLLNSIFEIGAEDDTLATIGLKVGSDVPFFIFNKPLIAEGRGEIFSSVDISLEGKYLTIVKPDFGVSTKEAYSRINPKTPDYPLLSSLKKDISEWKSYISNDFEAAVCNERMFEIKEQLYSLGASYVSLSGSGSAIYAISDSLLNTNNLFEKEFVHQSKI